VRVDPKWKHDKQVPIKASKVEPMTAQKTSPTQVSVQDCGKLDRTNLRAMAAERAFLLPYQCLRSGGGFGTEAHGDSSGPPGWRPLGLAVVSNEWPSWAARVPMGNAHPVWKSASAR